MDQKVIDLVTEWGFQSVLDRFKEEEVTYESLLLFSREDVKTFIPKVGRQVLFYENLTKHIKTNQSKKDIALEEDNGLEKDKEDNNVINVDSELESEFFTYDSISTSSSSLRRSETPISQSSSADSTIIRVAPSFGLHFETPVKQSNLLSVLEESAAGQAITKIYHDKGSLDAKCRKILVEIIIGHYLKDVDRRLNNSDLDAIAQTIIDLFPTEHKGVYYISPVLKSASRCNKSVIAKGKLVDKYRNTRSFIRKALFHNKKKHIDEKDIEEPIPQQWKDSQLWLKYNIQESWEQILHHWKTSLPLRTTFRKENTQSIAEFFETWPILKNSQGMALIAYDFDYLYTDRNTNLFSKWSLFFDNILEYKRNNLHISEESLLTLISDEISEDCKNTIKIILLGALLPPRGRIRKGKIHWKPSAAEATEGIILYVKTVSEIDEAIQIRVEKLSKYGLTLQPLVIIVGETLTTVSSVYTLVNNKSYIASSVLTSLDICFKLFHVLDAQYPPESEHIWLLIQKAIYKIETRFDLDIPRVIEMMEVLKNI